MNISRFQPIPSPDFDPSVHRPFFHQRFLWLLPPSSSTNMFNTRSSSKSLGRFLEARPPTYRSPKQSSNCLKRPHLEHLASSASLKGFHLLRLPVITSDHASSSNSITSSTRFRHRWIEAEGVARSREACWTSNLGGGRHGRRRIRTCSFKILVPGRKLTK